MISRSFFCLVQQFGNSKVRYTNNDLPSGSASTVFENKWQIMKVSNAKPDVLGV